MKTYFLSYEPCYLKVNGQYLGSVTINPQYAEIERDSLLEFIPKNSDFMPLFQTASEIKYHVDDFYVCAPNFVFRRNLPFKLLYQKSVAIVNAYAQVTVIINGGITFYIDGAFNAVEELPFVPQDFKLEFKDGFVFLSFYNCGKVALYIYSITNGGAKLVFKKIVNGFSYDGVLKTNTLYNFVTSLSLDEVWEFNGEFKLSKKSTTLYKNAFNLEDKLKNLLFFQMISVGADASSFLTPDLREKSNLLSEFIGSPILVVSHFYNPKKIIVITKEKASVYRLSYENGLISNVEES